MSGSATLLRLPPRSAHLDVILGSKGLRHSAVDSAHVDDALQHGRSLVPVRLEALAVACQACGTRWKRGRGASETSPVSAGATPPELPGGSEGPDRPSRRPMRRSTPPRPCPNRIDLRATSVTGNECFRPSRGRERHQECLELVTQRAPRGRGSEGSAGMRLSCSQTAGPRWRHCVGGGTLRVDCRAVAMLG